MISSGSAWTLKPLTAGPISPWDAWSTLSVAALDQACAGPVPDPPSTGNRCSTTASYDAAGVRSEVRSFFTPA
jgi:hypothetical protein